MSFTVFWALRYRNIVSPAGPIRRELHVIGMRVTNYAVACVCQLQAVYSPCGMHVLVRALPRPLFKPGSLELSCGEESGEQTKHRGISQKQRAGFIEPLLSKMADFSQIRLLQ